jgi:hypothetical protein
VKKERTRGRSEKEESEEGRTKGKKNERNFFQPDLKSA